MAKIWRYCPLCSKPLEDRCLDGASKRACTACEFVHWDSPVPVVAALIIKDGGFVLVKRAVAPFTGRWCLPRGFMRTAEIPKRAIVREIEEETGLRVRLHRILTECNPSPVGITLNQVTTFYLATTIGGTLNPGDDAESVSVFAGDALPDICFQSDVKLIREWLDGTHGTVDQPVNFAYRTTRKV